MTTTARQSSRRERFLRIGEVVRRLRDEFPDISISKVRYLEDEGLLMPRRTEGGYRLFSEEDVDRLRTILRLQRDECVAVTDFGEESRKAFRDMTELRRQLNPILFFKSFSLFPVTDCDQLPCRGKIDILRHTFQQSGSAHLVEHHRRGVITKRHLDLFFGTVGIC